MKKCVFWLRDQVKFQLEQFFDIYIFNHREHRDLTTEGHRDIKQRDMEKLHIE
jgi:hypothetical protein